MTRHICMTPSNTMSSTDASRFALKIIEAPIVIDYLVETHGIVSLLVAQVPNDEDWWDTVSKRSYAMILSQRHRSPTFDTLMAERELRWPDISTFNGPTVLRFAYGDALVQPPVDSPRRKAGRSEIYEIKPNNQRGKIAALQKLDDVEASYRKFGISGIYRRGIAYPFSRSGQKTITLETPYLALFKYLVILGLKLAGVYVSRVSIEVTRAEAGALLYNICVDLEQAERYTRDEAQTMAMFAVRMLWLSHTAFATTAVQDAAARIIESLVPDDASVTPRVVERIVAGKDLSRVPTLTITPRTMAPEIAPTTLEAIRQAMYSRLLGEPGDRFFLVADEAWYDTNVRLPGKAKVAAQIQLMRFDTTGAFKQKSAFIALTPPLFMTTDRALGELPLVGPVYRWMVDHPRATLIIVGCAIVITAAVVAAVASGGAAAPLSAEVTAAAMAAATGEMGGGVMAAAGATESVIAASVAPVEVATGAVRVGTGLLQWTRAVMQAGATRPELAQAAADEFALKVLADAAVKTALQVATKAGPVVVPGLAGVTTIGISARSAFAYGGAPTGAVSVANVGEQHALDVGHLLLVRVATYVRSQLPAIPELYKPFEVGDYLPTPEVRKVGRYYMLGAFDVQ